MLSVDDKTLLFCQNPTDSCWDIICCSNYIILQVPNLKKLVPTTTLNCCISINFYPFSNPKRPVISSAFNLLVDVTFMESINCLVRRKLINSYVLVWYYFVITRVEFQNVVSHSILVRFWIRKDLWYPLLLIF